MSAWATCTFCTCHGIEKVKPSFSILCCLPKHHMYCLLHVASDEVHAGNFFLKAKCFWRKEFRLGRLHYKILSVSDSNIVIVLCGHQLAICKGSSLSCNKIRGIRVSSGRMEHTFIESKAITKIIVTGKTSAGKIISLMHICTLWNDPYKLEGVTFDTFIGFASPNIIQAVFWLTNCAKCILSTT